jgi:hypothetical protein
VASSGKPRHRGCHHDDVAAVALWTPDYFVTIVPLAASAYDAFNNPLRAVLSQAPVLLRIGAVAAAVWAPLSRLEQQGRASRKSASVADEGRVKGMC